MEPFVEISWQYRALKLHPCLAHSAKTLPTQEPYYDAVMSVRYTTIPGYFLQDDPNTDPKTFDYVQNLVLRFSLVDR